MSEPAPSPVASAPAASAAASPVPAEDAVHFTIDGRPATGRKGEMLIAAAERAGTFIPRFCYHPRMKPVGMCRMCLVEVSSPRGASLQPSCFVEVAEGSEVVTTSDKVKKAQDGVLEFLLINHPLDCPVCDKGGECPLQDQTLAYGPGETRFVEEKRHFEKPIPISDLVLLDRERCIQCGRCTRFAAEIAGEAEIDFIGRGDSIEVNTFPELPFTSYFSGNTIQICPVGALTATQYRFTARPWDLDQVESTCTTCAVGCRVAVQSSANRVTRLMGIDAEPVNHGWLCDKGRFAYESVNSDERLVEPMVRKDGELVPATWYEALRAVADGLKKATGSKAAGTSAQGVGFIGGARLTNEGAYAWAKLAKGVLGTDSVDAQLGDGLPPELVLGLPRATIDQAATADTVVLLSGDLREELPVLFLRLRSAVVDGDLSVVELSPQTTSLTAYAAASLRYRAGEATGLAAAVVADGASAPEGVDAAGLAEARRLVAAENVVVVVGRPSLAEDATLVAEAAQTLAAALPHATFLPALRRGNVNGALDMGLAPGLLPGRTTLEDGRAWFAQAWGAVPSERGLDTAGMLGAAEAGHLGALVLLGADPRTDFPDRGLAQRALDNIDFIVSIATSPDASTAHADVVLPVAADHERPGTTTNIEGRISRVGQKLVAPGQAWADWVIAAELAAHLDGDLGLGSLSEVWDEIERLAPAYRGITGTVLEVAASVDGIVAPMTATPVELSRRRPAAPLDPIAVPGVESVERQGAPPRAGFAEFPTAETAAGQLAPNGNGPGGSARPALIRGPMALAPPRVPMTDSYSHRLVAGRRLYDHGAAVSSIPSLAGLVGASPLRANPHDLDDLGVAAGGRVRVRTAKTSVVVEVAPDPTLPRRVVAVDFNVPLGDGTAGDLIDATLPVTELRMETP
ncbi:MAG TPA: NADH-quinone oxidoreductase subunit NuoG [Acidimicrobiales bacterium]|jgi:NADH-quinone oxidoreductase subunit G|nr:NADH-quinone oxidoreductase subunit NuoG [Acidimicrobiales bacterium]